ncbi:hypothetical protein [Parasphingorhabdus pacifica]
MQSLVLTPETRYVAGAVLLTIVTIELGGWFMTRVVRGSVQLTDFQKAFARAGHAHAGVLVTLSLICLVLADATDLSGTWSWVARLGVPVAAALIPAGFFFSSIGRGNVTQPSKLIWLVWTGMLSLALGVVSLGVGLLVSG